jgi:hypothetical protein
LDEALMQNLALENNLSETAFVKVIDAENYEIRIWLEKLGYSVKSLTDNRGFTFSFKKE